MAAATQGWANWSNRARPAPRKIAASRSTRQVTAIDCNQWGRPSGECTAHYFETVSDFDVTELLPKVKIPTLVMHRRGDVRQPIEEGRRMATRIPGARFVALEGRNHIPLEHEPAAGLF